MGLTVAPISFSLGAWVAVVPLWFCQRTLQGRSLLAWPYLRHSLLMAIAWGGCFYGWALFWITGIHPMTWMGVPWLASLGIALFCWLAITTWGIVLVLAWLLGMGVWDWLMPRPTGLNRGLRLIWGVGLWCGLEAIWSQSILWWSPLAYGQSPGNLWLLHLGQLSGPGTISAAIMLINGLWAEILWQYSYHSLRGGQLFGWLGLPLGLIFLLHLGGWSLAQSSLADQKNKAITVGIIQGNIANEIKLSPEGWRAAIAGYTQGYQTLAASGSEVILTPEGALPYFWADIVAESSFYQAILQKKIPVWLGAYGENGSGYTNSLFSVDGTGKLLGRYDKVKLVPLGEYIPLQGVLGKFMTRFSPLKDQLVPGDPRQVFLTPFGSAAVSICYESAFPERFRSQIRAGSEFILSSANNAHYSATMPAQHHALDVMRAIDGDRWLARATNTGFSAIISPHGETRWLSQLDQYQLHQGVIYRRRTQTLYIRWGDWLTPLLLSLSGPRLLVQLRNKHFGQGENEL